MINSEEMKSVSQRIIYMPMYNEAWQTKSQAMQWSKRSTDGWTSKKMKYYSATKRINLIYVIHMVGLGGHCFNWNKPQTKR